MSDHEQWIIEREGERYVMTAPRFGIGGHTFQPVVRTTATQIITAMNRYTASNGRLIGGGRRGHYLIPGTEKNLRLALGGEAVARLKAFARALERDAEDMTLEEIEAMDAYLKQAPTMRTPE